MVKKELPFYATDKCFFDPNLVCRNTDNIEHEHYCRRCKHLPDLYETKVYSKDAEYFGSLEYALQIALSSSRVQRDSKFIVDSRSREVPKWALELSRTGMPEDHVRYMRDKNGFVWVSEPYTIFLRDLEGIIKACERLNLDLYITGRSSHMPGSCVRIEVREKKGD